MKLAGKRIAVTGGSGGIGTPLCRMITEAGGAPLIVGLTAPSSGDFLLGDLSSMEGIGLLADELARQESDILINLAGIQYFGIFEQQTREHMQRMIMVNLLAPMLLSQAVLPGMRARASGQIVNIGSVFGAIPFAHFVTYSSGKAGLKAFSQALRRELAGTGITVTHIAPRAVNTPLNDARVMQLAERTKMAMDTPEQVALRILRAIEQDRKEATIGMPEAFFSRINALLPGAVDAALQKNDALARSILTEGFH